MARIDENRVWRVIARIDDNIIVKSASSVDLE